MTMLWAWVAGAALHLHAQSVKQPQCTVEGVSRDCKVLQQRMNDNFIYLEDGSYFYNPEYERSRWRHVFWGKKKLETVSDQRRKRIEDLVEFARDTIVESIRQGRPNSLLKEEEKNEITRIQTVNFDFMQSYQDKSLSCVPIGPNAFYNPSQHRMTICRQAMTLPESALAFIIGHELGHAIDPCISSFPLIRKSSGELQVYMENTENSVDPKSMLAAAIPKGRYPQDNELDCLRGINLAKPALPVEKARMMAEKISNSSETQDPKTRAENLKKNEGLVRQSLSCYSEDGELNLSGESSADIRGSLVAGAFLAKKPPLGEMQRLATMSHFIDRLCGPQASTYEKTDPKDPHPPSRERLNKVFFADPSVQKALNCAPLATSCYRAVIASEEKVLTNGGTAR